MAIKIGPPVIGNDFFGRINEMKVAIEELKAGNHLSINAPRRVGKSSFVLRLKAILIKDHNWNGVFFDMEGASDEIDFAKRLINAIKENSGKLKKNILDALEGLDISIGSWVNFKIPEKNKTADDILMALAKVVNSIDGNFVIVVDELPIFLQYLIKLPDGEMRVKRFLHLLRSFKINESSNPNGNTVWIFCGSIGLESFVRKYKVAGAISELKPFELGAYSEQEANDFLESLSKRENFSLSKDHITHIVNKTGWPIPFFLAILFEETKMYCKDKDTVTIENIDIAYNKAIEKYSIKFETWYSRLNDQLELKESVLAAKILDIISSVKTGITFSQILDMVKIEPFENPEELKMQLTELLELLIHDGYLAKQATNYFFRSPLLRDWWINRRNL